MITYDYRCTDCAEIWEQAFTDRDEYDRTVAVICPVCGSGRTNKIISAPAVRIWWKDPRSSTDSWQMRPSFRKRADNLATRR